MTDRVSITIEFECPQDKDLGECMRLVLNQMRASPMWKDSAGTGGLNYVCVDHSLAVTAASIVAGKQRRAA